MHGSGTRCRDARIGGGAQRGVSYCCCVGALHPSLQECYRSPPHLVIGGPHLQLPPAQPHLLPRPSLLPPRSHLRTPPRRIPHPPAPPINAGHAHNAHPAIQPPRQPCQGDLAIEAAQFMVTYCTNRTSMQTGSWLPPVNCNWRTSPRRRTQPPPHLALVQLLIYDSLWLIRPAGGNAQLISVPACEGAGGERTCRVREG